jgi:hypothetical protein
MTNYRFFTGHFLVWPLAAALLLLLALPMAGAQAQSLKPASPLRLSDPASSAGTAGRGTTAISSSRW